MMNDNETLQEVTEGTTERIESGDPTAATDGATPIPEQESTPQSAENTDAQGTDDERTPQSTQQCETVPVESIVFREDLYPRIEHDAALVEQYASVIEKLPPIEVNQHYELIDGQHRLLAHSRAAEETIDVIITHTQSDDALLKLAIERNSRHGMQLSMKDKKSTALKMYAACPEQEHANFRKELADLFSVHPDTVRNWTRDIDRSLRDERDEKIFNMWLACQTQEMISAEVGIDQSVVSDLIKEFMGFRKFPKTHKFSEETARFSEEGFSPPIYNVWEVHSAESIVENLLWLYTDPFDIIVDPFAGGGHTIDACKKRLRRYYVSDLTPIVSRNREIRTHDIQTSMPKVPSWQDVKVVYLAPDKKADTGVNIVNIINAFAPHLQAGAKMAVLMQPIALDTDKEKRVFVDPIWEIIQRVKLAICARIHVPLSSIEMYSEQDEHWATDTKQLLGINRELIVWEV